MKIKGGDDMGVQRNINGFTLVEVIISIAMIGILMLGFLGMYTNGHRWVFDAGRRTEKIFEGQVELSKELIGEVGAGTGTVNVEDPTATLSLEFSQLNDTIVVSGDTLIWEDSDGDPINIRAFQPD